MDLQTVRNVLYNKRADEENSKIILGGNVIKKLLAFLLALAMLLSLAACGSEEKEETPEAETTAPEVEMTAPEEETTVPEVTYNDAGYWEVIRIESDDPDSCISEEDMAYIKAYGVVMYMELLENGTGVFDVDGDPIVITWQDGSFIDEEGLDWAYTLEEGDLSLTVEGTTLVFCKTEKLEPVVSELEQAGFTGYMELGAAYPYTNICYENEDFNTTGELTVTNYEIFASAEGYEPMEGYEWRVVDIEIRYFDDNAWNYGIWGATRYWEDYYNTKLHDDTSVLLEETDTYEKYVHTIIRNGQEMEAYTFFDYAYWSDWETDENGNHETIEYIRWEFLVPIGYDGCVVGFCDPYAEVPDGAYITDLNPADFLLFRLDNASATYVSDEA